MIFAEIVKLLLLIGYFFLQRKDPTYEEEFDAHKKEINKAFADRNIDLINIKSIELFTEARRVIRRARDNRDKE